LTTITPYNATNEYNNLIGKRIEVGLFDYQEIRTPARGTLLNETNNTITINKEIYMSGILDGREMWETKKGNTTINKRQITYVLELEESE